MMRGHKIELRPLRHGDIAIINRWRNDVRSKELLVLHPYPVSYEQDLEWFDKLFRHPDDRFIYFTVEHLESGQPVGYCNLRNVNLVHRHAELGIFIQQEHSRSGFGMEVLHLLVSYAFRYLNLRRIYIHVLSSNTPALAFFKAFGFREEGRLRNHVSFRGIERDMVIMGILAEEYHGPETT